MPFLYRNIHKIHHEYRVTIGMTAYYFHPVDVFMIRAFPSFLGLSIIASYCHIVTIYYG